MKVAPSMLPTANSEMFSKNFPIKKAVAGCKTPAATEHKIAGSKIGKCVLAEKWKRLFQPSKKALS